MNPWSWFVQNGKHLLDPLLHSVDVKSKEAADECEEKETKRGGNYRQLPRITAWQSKGVGEHCRRDDPCRPVAEVETDGEEVEMGEDGVPLDRADDPEDGEEAGHGVDRDLDGAPHQQSWSM